MLATRVIPVLLHRQAGLVKSVRFKDHKYVGDPINAVRILNEKEVDELVFLDIEATPKSRAPDFRHIADIASECFMPMGYGGGIQSVEQIRTLFKLGVEKAILNTAAVRRPDLIREAADVFGSQSIVVCLDVKKGLLGRYQVCTHGGTVATGLDPVAFAERAQAAGAGEIMLNSMDRDGTMQGYDLPLLRKVASTLDIPVIACGGAGSLSHFHEAIHQGGASAVAAGSLFVFYGKHRAVLINYPSRVELEAALA